MRIFFVEDDQNFGAVLKAYLEVNDYEVQWIDDGKDAISNFNAANIDLCILDVMLPHVDGFTIAKEIKHIAPNMPLLFLTAKSLKPDLLEGYRLGADDYITKPFDTDVLLYKIKAILLRHTQNNNITIKDSNKYSIGKYEFNHKIRTIKSDMGEQKLTPKEADLLRMLCLHKNDILPRETALKIIWGDDNYFTTRSMDVFITKLRKYFKDDNTIEINNLHGSGYVLTCPE